jgi:hypothetical protein
MNILIISLTHIQRSGAIAPAPNHTKSDLFMVFVLGGIEGLYLCIYRELKKSVKHSRRGIRHLAADQLRDLSLQKTALEYQKAAQSATASQRRPMAVQVRASCSCTAAPTVAKFVPPACNEPMVSAAASMDSGQRLFRTAVGDGTRPAGALSGMVTKLRLDPQQGSMMESAQVAPGGVHPAARMH